MVTLIYANYGLRHLLARDIRTLLDAAKEVKNDGEGRILVISPNEQHQNELIKILRNRIQYEEPIK